MAAMEEESKSEPKAQTKTLFEPKLVTETVPQPSQKPTQHEARQTTVRNDPTEVTQTPTVDLRPEREITMDRVCRFAKNAMPQTLPSVEVLQLARIWQPRYAGWDTEMLEARYFQWIQQKKKHDKFCLICVEIDPDHKCNTCQRAYHKNCLNPRCRKKDPVVAPGSGRALVAPAWHCPLCKKRTWNIIPPKDALTRRLVVERDERGLLLQKKFKKEPGSAVSLTWTDNGTRESDFNLLFKLDAIDEQRLQNALHIDKDFVSDYKAEFANVEPIADSETVQLQRKAEEMEREIKALRQIQRLDKERRDVLGGERKHKPVNGHSYESYTEDDDEDNEDDEDDEDAFGYGYGTHAPF